MSDLPFPAETLAQRLRQATLPTVANGACQLAYDELAVRTRLDVHNRPAVQSTQLCAGGELGVDSCKGDSGGPLVYPATVRTAQMVQFGIVSLGVEKCGNDTTLPGLYTRVGHHMKWLLDQLRE